MSAGHNSDGQLRAFIDRILRLKAEQDSLADDIKEVYAEAKATGYDKTAMGSVVSYLRKREKDAAKVDEQSAIFDLYLASYEGGAPRTHTHARESLDPKLVETIAQAVQTKTGTTALIAAIDIMIEREEASLPPHDPGELADIDVAMFDEPDSSEPNSSPAETDKPGEVPPSPSSGAPFPAPHSPPADDGQPGKQGSDAGGAKMDGACEAPPERAAPAGTIHAKSEPAVTPFTEDDVPAFLRPPKPQKPLRAGCLEPECCASYSAGLCHRCTKAAAEVAA